MRQLPVKLSTTQGRLRLFSLVLLYIVNITSSIASDAPIEDTKAQSKTIAIVVSKAKQRQSDFTLELTKHLTQQNYKTLTLLSEALTVKTQPEKVDMFIVLGFSAFKTLQTIDVKAPSLSLFISRSSYETYQNKNAQFENTAIFSDSPHLRQLALIKSIMPNAKVVGVLSDENDTIDTIKKSAKKLQLSLFHRQATTDNLIKRLVEVSRNSDVLFSQMNSSIYNSATIKSIILTTYRYDKAIVGNSTQLLRLGHMATVYASANDILKEVKEYFASGKLKMLPKPHHSKYFSVMVNYPVANSLNIQVPKETALRQQIISILAGSTDQNE